jgi:uncharacterized phage protein (TIGR02218 family)
MNEILLLEINSNQNKLCFNNSQSVVNYNNNAFLPTPFDISKIVLSGNLTESFAEIRMIFSETINSPDIISGIFMGQQVILRKIVDGMNSIIISGIISAYSSTTTEFSFVITDEIYKFKEPVLEKFTTKCKTSFCSNECNLKPENYSANGEIVEVGKSSVTLKETPPSVLYANGVATIFSQKFTKTIQIRDAVNKEIFFFEDIPFFVKNGDKITLLQACDKTFAMCGKFENQEHFRGEIVI